MTRSDIAHLCAHVSDFAQLNSWCWECSPVIAFEFTSMGDYFHAKTQLAIMIASEPMYAMDSMRHSKAY